MKKVLVIHSSPNGAKSVSRKLTAKIIDRLIEKHGHLDVVHRDLDANSSRTYYRSLCWCI